MALLAIVALPAEARTLRVEKDGSGDYTVIQDALDAAAPGDTVRIGPGRFEDFQSRDINGYSSSSIGFVTVAPLTILGAGPESTVLGPQTQTSIIDGLGTKCFFIDADPQGVTLSQIGLENTRHLIYIRSDSVAVSQCRFTGSETAQLALAGVSYVSVEECRHVGSGDATGYAIVSFAGTDNPHLTVRDSSFRYVGLSVTGATDMLVERCVFEGQRVGLYAYETSGGVVRDCQFSLIENVVVALNNETTMEISGCDFGGGAGRTIEVAGTSHAHGAENRFGSGSFATLRLLGSVQFSDCDIRPGGEYTVYNGVPASYALTLDLRNNYWFTTDAEAIAAGIHDGNDDPSLGIVQFEPFLMQSVPTETTSFGELKARYGGR